MYKRAFEQIVLSTAASLLGIISVFVIVGSAPKDDYGTFVSALALQYVIARVVLSGVLVETQLRLAEAVNSDGAVSVRLPLYAAVSICLTVLVLVVLWALQLIVEPMLGILMSASMIVSIAALSMNSWFWYRASIFVPELMLLSLLYNWRNELNLDALYRIYYSYYCIQAVLAIIGIIRMRGRIYLTSAKFITLTDLIAGCIATVTTLARDRLTVAAAGFLYSPGSVAELAYLMTVLKGAVSIGGAMNSVKFVQLAGKRNSITFGIIPLLLENLVIVLATILGYLSLWYYTLNFGNPKYINVLCGWGIMVMTISVALIFNHSIWYTNQLISEKLTKYNYSSLIFCAFFAILVGLLYITPFVDIIFFFGITQVLLAGSAVIYGSIHASKTL
jgi:hypothetical protein